MPLCRAAVWLLLTGLAAFAELRVGRAGADDPWVKALVLDDGQTRVALAMCDAISVDQGTVETARRRIAAQSSIPEANIMIAVTGARSGPVANAARIAEAVRLALASAVAAQAWVGQGREDAAGYYNRFLMKDGTVRANPGKLNPDIVQPAGEADPDLTLAGFETPVGHVLALFGSYSLRAIVDYPAAIARVLGKVHGAELVTLWSTGAGANVSHIDVRSKAPQQGAAEARRVGTVLAGEAIKAGARAAPVRATSRLGVARETVKLAPRQAGQPPVQAEVQVIVLGDSLAWVALPGELWTELGAAIRKASPFPVTLLVGSANGGAGVFPTRRGYADGGPEMQDVLAAAGSGETVADAAARLLAEARRRALL